MATKVEVLALSGLDDTQQFQLEKMMSGSNQPFLMYSTVAVVRRSRGEALQDDLQNRGDRFFLPLRPADNMSHCLASC